MQIYGSVAFLTVQILIIIMAPTRVFPEESPGVSKPVSRGHFDIPVATQVKIYAELDGRSQGPDENANVGARGSVPLLQRRLSEWFPNGLLWTEDDDAKSDDDNAMEVGTVLNVEEDSVGGRRTRKMGSFLEVLRSFDEGERILNEEFDSSSASSDSNNATDLIDDHFGLGDKSGRKRRGLSDDDNDDTAAESDYDDDPGSMREIYVGGRGICEGVPPPKGHHEGEDISCYTCSSSTSDDDPQCDHRLWKYLRHSEKFNLRGRCGHSGHVCMKRVSRRFGERITERGCVATPLLIPAGDEGASGKNRTKEVAGDGCYTHSQKNGFLTTACFCKSSLCNHASLGGSGDSSLFSMVFICLALLLYGIALAFFQDKA